MDIYNLRTRTQARVQRMEEHTERGGPAQTVPTTSEEDRRTDRQTDIPITHQTEHHTPLAAPHLHVGSTLSGIVAHALGTQSVSSSQFSEDPTIDFSVQELFAEDSELASTHLDTSFRGQGEERPAFPGLTLPATGSILPGAAPGLDIQDPSLGLHTGVGSCPQAVVTAHPDAHAGTLGTSHSAHLWGESKSLLEQETSLHQPTTTATISDTTITRDPTLLAKTYHFARLFTPFWVNNHG